MAATILQVPKDNVVKLMVECGLKGASEYPIATLEKRINKYLKKTIEDTGVEPQSPESKDLLQEILTTLKQGGSVKLTEQKVVKAPKKPAKKGEHLKAEKGEFVKVKPDIFNPEDEEVAVGDNGWKPEPDEEVDDEPTPENVPEEEDEIVPVKAEKPKKEKKPKSEYITKKPLDKFGCRVGSKNHYIMASLTHSWQTMAEIMTKAGQDGTCFDLFAKMLHRGIVEKGGKSGKEWKYTK